MRSVLAGLALAAAIPVAAWGQDAGVISEQETVSPALEQLRHVIGSWDVTTEFLDPDGSVAGTFEGTYIFAWVHEDAVASGVSSIPAFGQSSGILFYLRPTSNEIEMVSVGPDGQLWVMTGPQDSETRETPVVAMPDGTTMKLRFTRFNVEADRFESRMQSSTDGGVTWVPGNHQIFVRQVAD